MSDTTTNGTAIPVEVTADEMRVYGAKVWTESNDGAGSGLDADTLDSLDSTQFLRSDIENAGNSQFVDVTASGSLYGNLVGTADHAVSADNATNAQDAVNAQNAVNAQEAQHAITADSATNAGTVDGLNGSQFLRSDIENTGNSQFVDVTASGKFYGDLVGTADNASTLDDYSADLSSTPNTIALRNSTGDLYAQQFKSEVPNETTIDPSAALAFRNNNTDDNGIRFIEDSAAVRDWMDTLSADEIYAALALKADKSYIDSRATKLAFDKGIFEGI